MLSKLRSQHVKKVLWALLIFIIPGFVLWSGLSIFKSKRQMTVGYVGKDPVSFSDLAHYYQMAHVDTIFESLQEKNKKDKEPITSEDLQAKAWEYIILLWKAKKEKIDVKDDEVQFRIKLLFFPRDKFRTDIYVKQVRRMFGVEPRLFEEFQRNFIIIDKLLSKYLDIKITDDDIKKLYQRDTLKAQLSYILIPYEKFNNQINITDDDREKCYKENGDYFRQEAKIKINYTILTNNDEMIKKLNDLLPKVKTLNELKANLALEIKETGYFGEKDPIEGIGMASDVSRIAFSLETGKLSPPLPIKEGILIIEKIDHQPVTIPPMAQIKDRIDELIKETKTKELAQKEAENLLRKIEIEKITDLKSFAEKEKLECKDTNTFNYYDFIEGMGLDREINEIAFSLKKGEIYKSPILLIKGASIIQLKDITELNATDYGMKKFKYYADLYREKFYIERLKYMTQLEKEANLKVYPLVEEGKENNQ